MSSTYSNSLRVELIGSGDQAGTWGTTTDNNFAYIFDTAIAGYQTVAVSASSQALTYLNGPTSSASLNQSVYAMLRLTTSTGAAFAIYAPPVSKTYIIYNNSGYTATIYNSTVIGNTTAAGAGISISDGNRVMVFSNGTNFYDLQAQNLTGTLAIANGGTGQTTQQAAINALAGTQTANRVLRSDGTNTTLSQVALATDVSGTLPVTSGGTGVTSLTALGNLFYPVGSIYSSTVSTNPGTLLGFGTWSQFGAGRMMMGAGGSYAAGSTGGSADAITVAHTHTGTTNTTNTDHTHNLGANYPSSSGGYNFRIDVFGGGTVAATGGMNSNTTHSHTFTTDSTGSSGTNANLPPYVVVYMWQRTA